MVGARLWALFTSRTLHGTSPALLTAFVLLKIAHGCLKAGFKDPAHPSRHDPPFEVHFGLELIKLAATVGWLYVQEKWVDKRRVKHAEQEPLVLQARGEEEATAVESVWGRKQKWVVGALVGGVFFVHHLLLQARAAYSNQVTLDIVDALPILFVILHQFVLLRKGTPLTHITSALLQIVALCLLYRVTKVPQYPHAAYSLLLTSAAVSSLFSLMPFALYTVNADFHRVNRFIFLSTTVAAFIGVFACPAKTRFFPPRSLPRDWVAAFFGLGMYIVEDLLGLAIVHQSSPFTFWAVSLLSTSLNIPLSRLAFPTTISFTNVQMLAAGLALYTGLAYLADASSPHSSNPRKSVSRLNVVLLASTFVPLLAAIVSHGLTPIPHSTESYIWNHENWVREHTTRVVLPHQHSAAYNTTERAWNDTRTCVRRPLPLTSVFDGPGDRPDFHAFDDVLVVVFFSHARYDINLDGYREAYSAYFPNLLFIGPASREDRGFTHSYDVALDSYMSHEDLDVGWPKLGGRMAHHMFYTAVKDHPCYGGYLWAPFDALLNIPRLMQFPQDRLWYHSPFATRFVPNPAQTPQGTADMKRDEQVVLKRPPPAQVSDAYKTAYGRYEKNARSWGGAWEWWWGEKYVGLGACLRFFYSQPQHMRDRLAGLTGSEHRVIGGSADTMYIPGHLRADFLDVLGTFLRTDCFLEIALPTTLHLILPADEEIVWVDHWWKNDPPFNTTYVRDLWAAGYEVDSFHSFHWGDVQADGFFGPNRDAVRDVRALLADSFARQGTVPPS
ncbi:hypothetical protein MIND_01231400 [Mycena indigotica]|uniref:Uncharacterized protein n=1 Tax=Mycena indigotica TaxID=2126181 RepID=A0A8H6VVW2_9AGAR|nr:uncharacterized protein MIND_01231400 [Mycena indigotica]KAF7292053.1 hypothetical protein MIND_01231400 [Mycena indigotica]